MWCALRNIRLQLTVPIIIEFEPQNLILASQQINLQIKPETLLQTTV